MWVGNFLGAMQALRFMGTGTLAAVRDTVQVTSVCVVGSESRLHQMSLIPCKSTLTSV